MPRINAAILMVMLCLALTMVLPLAGSLGETTSLPSALAFAELTPAESGDAPAPVASSQLSSTTSFTVTLPLIFRDYFPRLPCSAVSPFGIEIAALHQVQPPTGQAPSVDTLAEAAWLERVKAGFPTLVGALEASGACWTRVWVDWAAIQPQPPPAPYVWGPYHDDLLGLVAESGVQMIVSINNVPAWAGVWANGPLYDGRLDEFAQFLFDLVSRYRLPPYNIHTWELFNEPDWTDRAGGIIGWGENGDKYAQMATAAYTAIKAADPEATVLMGGVAYDWFTEYKGPFYRYFSDEVMAAGGAAYLDALNFHYFPDFASEWERWVPNGNPPTCGQVEDGQGEDYEAWGIDLVAKTNHFRNRLYTCFQVDKPVWVTELAEHGNAGQPEVLAQQARYVVQGNTRALAAGVKRVIWYALVAPPYDPWDQGLLFEDDWSPKPAFYTYRTLAYEMQGYAYAYSLNVPGLEGYVFRDAARQEKTVAWVWGEPGRPAYLTIAAAGKLRVVDRRGQVTYVQDGGPGDVDGIQNGSVRLRLPAPPVDPDPENPPARFTAEPFFISK